MVGNNDKAIKNRLRTDSNTDSCKKRKLSLSSTQIGGEVNENEEKLKLIAQTMLTLAETNPNRDEHASSFYKYTLKSSQSFAQNHKVVRCGSNNFLCVFYLMGLCGHSKSYRGSHGAAHQARRHVANDQRLCSKVTVQPSGCRKYAVHYNDQGAEETVVYSSEKTVGQVQSPVTVSAIDEENLCYTLKFGESFEAGYFGVTDGEKHCCVLARLGQCTSRLVNYKTVSGIVFHSVSAHGRKKKYGQETAKIKPPEVGSNASAFFRVKSLYYNKQGDVIKVAFARSEAKITNRKEKPAVNKKEAAVKKEKCATKRKKTCC